MITDAHNTRYCSPIGRSTAPARIPIVRLYEVNHHGQGGGVNLQQHSHKANNISPAQLPSLYPSLAISPIRDQDPLFVRHVDPRSRSSRLRRSV